MGEYQEGFEDAIFSVADLLKLLCADEIGHLSKSALMWHIYTLVHDPRVSLGSEKEQIRQAVLRARGKLQRQQHLAARWLEEYTKKEGITAEDERHELDHLKRPL